MQTIDLAGEGTITGTIERPLLSLVSRTPAVRHPGMAWSTAAGQRLMPDLSSLPGKAANRTAVYYNDPPRRGTGQHFQGLQAMEIDDKQSHAPPTL